MRGFSDYLVQWANWLDWSFARIRQASERITKSTIVLLGLFLAIFLFRFLSINSQLAPPSEDLGGDLIVLHTYTQQNPVYPYFKYEAPPLYYFLIVWPITTLFPTLTGLKIIDALVPSILIFPFYFLCKLVAKDRWASLIGGGLFSFSEAFNEMLGWGGTLNMFAFVFAIAALCFLVKLLREKNRRNGLLTAAFISLTIGTHQLTALFLGVATLSAFAISYVPRLRLHPSLRLYLLTITVGGVLSLPYAPYYFALSSGAVNVGPTYVLSLHDIITTMVYTNARTNLSVLLLISSAIGGAVFLARRAEWQSGLTVILASLISTISLAFFINSAIYNRAAYFLPITLFVAVAGSFSFLTTSPVNRSRRVRVLAILIIAIVLTGFVVADINRFESAVSYYQIVTPQTLDALNWISSNTSRNDTVFTNFPGLAAWIAGYSERSVLYPRQPGYIVTAPDLIRAAAATTVDSGNYVLSSQGVIVGDFFPSSIYNSIVYLNSISGRQGLLFLDDDYNSLNFTDVSGIHTSNLVSGQSKTFEGYSQNGTTYSMSFNYTWTSAKGIRTVALTPPNVIRTHFDFYAMGSNATAFAARIIALSGEEFSYTSLNNNSGTLIARLQSGNSVSMSVVVGTGNGSVRLAFSDDDPSTNLPTLTITASGPGPEVVLDTSIALTGVDFGPDITFDSAFAILKLYGVSYLLLDVRAYSQQIRFLHSQVSTTIVFANPKIMILKISL